MDKSASCKIFEEYVDSLFPIGGKRSRRAAIRQGFAKRIVDHLKGKQDSDASFRHFVKKGGFALLDMPSAGIRDVLVVSLKEEKQVRFHSTYSIALMKSYMYIYTSLYII